MNGGACELFPRKKLNETVNPARRAWLKRQAIHIAAQLPENEDDAIYVLEAARELVDTFMSVK